MKADMFNIATFDRFDIVDAWYTWLCSHHVGIVPGSDEYPDGRDHRDWWQSYNRLSWLPNRLHYRPSPMLSEENMSENSREIYNDLCRRAGWCKCLEE